MVLLAQFLPFFALVALGWWLGVSLPGPLDRTVDLLAQATSPTALFTLGGILAREQMQRVRDTRVARAAQPVWLPVVLKLVGHPLLVWGAGLGLQHAGVALPTASWCALILAAALPSANNVSMLAEREGAQTALVARIILWTTALALLTLTLWAQGLGVQAGARSG